MTIFGESSTFEPLSSEVVALQSSDFLMGKKILKTSFLLFVIYLYMVYLANVNKQGIFTAEEPKG